MATYKFVAKDLMTEKVVCVHPETPINDLIKYLSKTTLLGRPSWKKEEGLLGLFQRRILLNITRRQVKNGGVLRRNRFIAIPTEN